MPKNFWQSSVDSFFVRKLSCKWLILCHFLKHLYHSKLICTHCSTDGSIYANKNDNFFSEPKDKKNYTLFRFLLNTRRQYYIVLCLMEQTIHLLFKFSLLGSDKHENKTQKRISSKSECLIFSFHGTDEQKLCNLTSTVLTFLQ